MKCRQAGIETAAVQWDRRCDMEDKGGTHHHSVGEETAHPPHYHHHQSLAVAITTTTSEEHTKNILSRDDEETLDFCGGGIPFYMLVETGARNISCSTVDIDFDLGGSSSSV